MTPDTKKYVEKHWSKVNGKVHLIEETIYGHLLVIVKGGKHPRYLAMQFGKNSPITQQATKLSKGDRVKCRYLPKSTEYKGKWYTNLELKDISPWPVNEDKLKKKAAMEKIKENSQYGQGKNLFNSWENEELNPTKLK